MGSLYIGVILICRVAQHLTYKSTSNDMKGLPMFIGYSAYRQLLSALFGIILIVIGKSAITLDKSTLLISGFSGLMLVASMFCGIFAMKSGTVALVSMFSTAGLIVPCIAGVFLFNEKISVMQWVGVAVFLFSAYLLIGSSKNIYKNFSFKTIILLIAGLVTDGCVMLAQTIFARCVPNGNISVFSFFSFLIPGVILLIMTLIIRPKNKNEMHMSKTIILCGVVLALCVFVINQLATLASRFVSPVILFTFINGGSTIIGAIVAALFFKEKLTLRSAAGVIIGVASLVIIKAFA